MVEALKGLMKKSKTQKERRDGPKEFAINQSLDSLYLTQTTDLAAAQQRPSEVGSEYSRAQSEVSHREEENKQEVLPAVEEEEKKSEEEEKKSSDSDEFSNQIGVQDDVDFQWGVETRKIFKQKVIDKTVKKT